MFFQGLERFEITVESNSLGKGDQNPLLFGIAEQIPHPHQ